MAAAGLIIAATGGLFIWSAITGYDLRDVIPNVLSGKPLEDSERIRIANSPDSDPSGRSGGGFSNPSPDNRGGGGSGGGSFTGIRNV